MESDVGVRAPSWRRTVDRAVMASGAFVLLVQISVCLGATGLLTPADDRSLLVRIGVVVAVDVVLVGVSVLAGWRPRLLDDPAVAAVAAGVAVIAVVVACGLPTASGAGAALQIVPVNALQALDLVALGFVVRWRLAAAIIVGSGPLYVGLRTWAADASALSALDEWVAPTTISLGVLAVLRYLRAGADRSDRLLHDARRRSVARARADNADLARDEARRVVHDDVISALRVVELGLDESSVRRSADAALRSLDGTTGTATLDGLLADLRDAAPLELEVDRERWRASPPPRVLAAMGLAAAEALRNVSRHSGVGTAHVTLVGDERTTVVTVDDTGRGLGPDHRPGFGIRESIEARMDDVGGTATVGPGVHAGTSVRLEWPEPQRPVGLAAESLVPRIGTVLWPLAAAAAVSTVYALVRHPGDHPLAGAAVAVAVLSVLAGAVVVITRARRRRSGLGTAQLVVAGLVVSALTWLGLLAAGPGALTGPASWVVGSCANVVALLAFEVTALRVAPVIAAQVLTVVASGARDPLVTATEPLGAIATCVVVGGLGVVLGSALRGGERRLLSAQAAQTAALESASWSQAGEASRREHLAHLEDDVVPYLRAASADGTADAGDAVLLSLRCRDALYLDRPLDATTRASVQAARRAGVVVTIRAGSHDADRAWPLLRQVLTAVEAGARVTVLPPAGAREVAGGGRVVVVPPVPPARRSSALPAGEHDDVRSTFRVPAGPSSVPPTAAGSPGAVEVGP